MTRHAYLAAALVASCAAPQRPQVSDAADPDGPALTKAWQDRLARPALRNTTHFIRSGTNHSRRT
jgi:hypothetical protein